MGKVTVLIENKPSRVFRVDSILSIGRDSNNDIQIIDAKVSRRHSTIEKRMEGYFVKDLGSRNGTFLNGVAISENTLANGDRIKVGDTEIMFEVEPLVDFAEDINKMHVRNELSSHIKILDHTFELKRLADFDETFDNTRRLRKALTNLTTLFELGHIINTARDSTALMNLMLDQIQRIIPADRIYLLMREERTGTLIPVASYSTENDRDAPQISKTILSQVVDKGLSILSPDAFQDERFQGSESIFIHSIRSAMCAPLRSREKILGAIHVDTKGSFDTFTEDDLKMLTAIGITAGIAIENMHLYEDLKRLFHSTVKSLVATVEANDQYTGGHSVRVADYATHIAQQMDLADEDVELVQLAAFLHDVGKVSIPEHILNKKGAFDDSEFELIKHHPSKGADILSKIEGMEKVSMIVRHHHERYDGSGYPDGLRGNEIPLASRILGVADTLDAITTDRAYRKKRDIHLAIDEIIRCAGSQFDPEIIRALKQSLENGTVAIQA